MSSTPLRTHADQAGEVTSAENEYQTQKKQFERAQLAVNGTCTGHPEIDFNNIECQKNQRALKEAQEGLKQAETKRAKAARIPAGDAEHER